MYFLLNNINALQTTTAMVTQNAYYRLSQVVDDSNRNSIALGGRTYKELPLIELVLNITAYKTITMLTRPTIYRYNLQ